MVEFRPVNPRVFFWGLVVLGTLMLFADPNPPNSWRSQRFTYGANYVAGVVLYAGAAILAINTRRARRRRKPGDDLPPPKGLRDIE